MSPALGNPVDLVRPEVRQLSAYHLDQVPCRFKLDQNEVPQDLPRRLKEEVARRLLTRDWARYPDFHGNDLRRDLGALHGHPWEGVLVGNGSNELLGAAIEALVPPGGEILSAHPTFSLYRMFALRVGAGAEMLPPRDDLKLPLDEMEAEIEAYPKRPVVLCTPNNPTGDAATPERVQRLLEKLEGPLLLDNAYGEFCRFDYRPLLAEHPHLLIFRTFSKAWCLAGLRLAYVLAHPELTAEILKVKLPYNLGHAGIVAGRVVLEAREVLERRVRLIRGRRERWAEMLRGFGFTVYRSEANFLLVRSPEGVPIETVRDGLADRGILVRDVSHYPGLSDCMRVSIGDGRAERAVERALTEILETSSNPKEAEP